MDIDTQIDRIQHVLNKIESIRSRLGVDKIINKGMRCEKCDGEVRINSHNELWCKNCAMLIHACKCHLTKVGETKLKF